MFALVAFLALAFPVLNQARKVTVANLCSAPVWAAYNGDNAEAITVNGESGVGMWQQASGQEDVLEVPENWAVGRIWPATGCDDTGNNCMVGGCLGGKCDGKLAGQTGATLAEFTMHPEYETFDISIVDGFSVPLAIIPSGGIGGDCRPATCGAETDILTVCDPSLAYPQGSDTVWSCVSPCTRSIDFVDQAAAKRSCCPENNATACPSDTIPFYEVYKPLCYDAFLYAPDFNGNMECNGPEYRVEFCPGGNGVGANPSGNAPVAQCAGGEITGGGTDGTNDNGGGTTSGIPEGAGQACDTGASGVNGGSSGSSGTSGNSGSGSGSSGSSSSAAGGAGTAGTEAASSAAGAGGAGTAAAGAGTAAGTAGSGSGSTAAAGGAGTAAAQPGSAAGVATGDGASGGVAASNAGYWGTVASSAAGDGGTASANNAANTAANTAAATGAAAGTAAVASQPAGQGGAATSAAAPSASSACRGRGCRGTGRGGRNGRKRQEGSWGWVW